MESTATITDLSEIAPLPEAPTEVSASDTETPKVLKVTLTKDQVERKAKDAIMAYYSQQHRSQGPLAAVAVSYLADYVNRFEPTNAEVSGILKEAWTGETLPVRITLPPKGARGQQAQPFVETINHPYKQHGQRWRDLAYFQAGKHRKGDLEIGKWPTLVNVGGKDYNTPVAALADGNSLERVQVAWRNIIRPNVIDLSDLTPGNREGRILAAMESVRPSKGRPGFQVAVRVFSKKDKRHHRKNLPSKDYPELAAGAVVGLLMQHYSDGVVRLDDEHRSQIAALLTDGTLPTFIRVEVPSDEPETK